jgi:XRE family transcriptional regulator, stress-response regulator
VAHAANPVVRYEQMPFAKSETSELIQETLGRLLRARREAAGRTLTEVAEAAELSPAFLSEVERGLKDVSTDRLVHLAHALGVSASEIYLDLGRELEGGSTRTEARAWPHDPRLQLRRAAATLPPAALRSVADFSVYLAMSQSGASRRRIGFRME